MKINNKIVIFIMLILGIGILIFSQKEYDIEYDVEKYIGIQDREFKEYVVFYPQHQDDEVLWGGSAMRTAINTLGADNVFVVLVSDGTGVNVFKEKIYMHKNRKEKEEFRNREFYASLEDIGIKKENIIILSDIDMKSGEHFELMREVALNFENKYKNVTHVAQSYKFDDHPMHRKNGRVIYKLYEEGTIKDVMFYVKPKYIKNIPPKERVIYQVRNINDYGAIMDACNEYKLVNDSKGRMGIGYTSAHSYFDHLFRDPTLTSILHLPF